MVPPPAFEQSLLVGKRSGERPFDMAEQQTFQQSLGQRAAIDRQKKFVSAVAMGVQRQRNQLLAGAAVAGNQHGCLGVGDFLDHLQNVANGFALADDIVEVKFHEPYDRALEFERFPTGAAMAAAPNEPTSVVTA